MIQLLAALVRMLRRVSRIKWSHCFRYITAGQPLHCFDSEFSRRMDSSIVPLAWFPEGTSFTQPPSISSNNNYVSSTWSLVRNTYWRSCGIFHVVHRLLCGARPKCTMSVATLINVCIWFRAERARGCERIKAPYLICGL